MGLEELAIFRSVFWPFWAILGPFYIRAIPHLNVWKTMVIFIYNTSHESDFLFFFVFSSCNFTIFDEIKIFKRKKKPGPVKNCNGPVEFFVHKSLNFHNMEKLDHGKIRRG